MDEIILVDPSIEYEDQIFAFKNEILASGDNDAFAGCGTLRMSNSITEWLEIVEKFNDPIKVPKGYVPSNTYLAIRIIDNRLVGIIDLRHHINHPILSLWGGHIGYSVRPSERNKGYGKEMLRLNLINCINKNIHKVMVTCHSENIASESVIIANGGIFEKEIDVNGSKIKRYWITL